MKSIAAFALTLLLAAHAWSQSLLATVVAVHDGDTVTVVIRGGHTIKVRLNGIDAPELKQKFGKESQEHLATAVDGKDVLLIPAGTDVYGRTIGTIYCDGADQNLAQLTAGLAWYNFKYKRSLAPPERLTYAAAEAEAKTQNIGLWSEPNRVAPWLYRHGIH